MSTKIFNQKGFTVLETILIAVVLAGVVGAGVYVWTSRQEAKTETASVEVKKSSYDLEKAENNVDDFYTEYLQKLNSSEVPDVKGIRAVVEKYSTDSFYNKYISPNQYDYATCSQNSYESAKVVSVKTSGEGAEANVDLLFDQDKLSIKVIVDKDYKVSDVVCPTS